MKRTCSAFACNQTINVGATFCSHHWHLVPGHLQILISTYNKRARNEGPQAVQHRWMYTLLIARQAVSKAENRGSQPIAPAYKAAAEREQTDEDRAYQRARQAREPVAI